LNQGDPSFDPRRHSRQTQSRLVLAGLLIVLVVGGGLVWLFYGRTAALTAVSCILAVGAVFGLLWLFLGLLERWAGEDRR
jgi:hypothetical protein